jgi:hypothetical protein
MTLPEHLKAILACPICKGALELREDRDEAWCVPCQRVWPIKDGVPDLALESSSPLRR